MVKNFKIKTIRLLVLFIFCLSFFGVLLIKSPIALAQSGAEQQEIKTMYFTPQIEIPFSSISGETPVGSVDEDGFVVSDLLARYLKAIYDYGIMVGGILAALMLMGGGLIWLTSGGDSGKVSKAKDIIAGSITGVVLLMGAYFILNTINPDLVEMKGVKMIVAQNVEIDTVSCCTTKGMLKINIKTTDGQSVYADSTSIVGKNAGEEFKGCWEEFLAEDCQGGSCSYDRNAKSYLCTNPNNICCVCSIGTNFMNNKYNICKNDIPITECDTFCANELITYNNKNNTDYKLYTLSFESGFGHINPSAYTCQELTSGAPKGSTCKYNANAGGKW